ncbi:hypothetical protein [Pseudomonas sp. ATCC PTA-122608]|uniref:phosphoribosyltransferase-like protein n=1 Tax=Pseudomonas sp. ATCC PTA-122608 TaxID=1771311 RepID=UPI0013566C8D|nr:hypothetical protein [Pseudomonas sp. ATCC PTA-122608]
MRINNVCKAWLEQFRSAKNQSLAKKLLRKLRVVTDKELTSWLKHSLDISNFKNPTAIYIERELQKTKSKLPPPMYKQSSRRPRRIEGSAAQAVQSLKYSTQTIGSEGKIATKLDQICSRNRKRLFLQPSATKLRDEKVRNFVIVTDLVGSGDRICKLLDSLWRPQTIKSWNSYGLIKFYVLCYAITEGAEAIISKHSTNPIVIKKIICPTIKNSFIGNDLVEIEKLCKEHGAFSKNPLGYKNSGTLIAFDDKAPNNMPAIFIERRKSIKQPWMPLFPERLTSDAITVNTSQDITEAEIFKLLGCDEILSSTDYQRMDNNSRLAIVLAVAAGFGYTQISDLASLTDLSLEQIVGASRQAQELGLLSPRKKVTNAGKRKLRKLMDDGSAAVGKSDQDMYYPRQLRAPV